MSLISVSFPSTSSLYTLMVGYVVELCEELDQEAETSLKILVRRVVFKAKYI